MSRNDALLMVSSPSENRMMTGHASGCRRWLNRVAAVSTASSSGVAEPGTTWPGANEEWQLSAQIKRASKPAKDITERLSSGFHGGWEISCSTFVITSGKRGRTDSLASINTITSSLEDCE